MERCSQCGGAHATESCGRPSALASPRPEVGSLLSRSNLARMRARWEEAADLCVQALRLDPSNPTAHSLLGDIYQDQGRPEEARHWYQLALEIQPASEADRAKLARVEEALEARQQRAEWAAVIEGRAQPIATSLLVRESLQRVGAIVGAGLCGIILVMATLVSVSERTGAAPDDSPAGIYTARRRQRAVQSADTWRERSLYRRTGELQQSSLFQLVRAEIDPVERAISVRIFLPRASREGLTAPRLRERVLREAYRWAFAARQAAAEQHEAEELTQRVRVVVVGPPNAVVNAVDSDFLLTAQLSRNDLVVEPDVVTAEELQTFFSRLTPINWMGDLQ